MELLPLQLALAAAACAGGGWLCVSRWARARHLQDTPTSKIRSAAQGHVELYGVLLEPPGPGLFGPLTGKPCLWWRYSIEEYTSRGRGSRWLVLEKGSSSGWLRLSDGSGECLIDPRGAEVLPARRERWTGDLRHPAQGMGSPGWLGALGMGRQYRYTEERLHVGEPLYAIGEFCTLGGGGQGLDRHTLQGQVIREWKGDFAGLLQRFDSNGDGRFDEDEWQRVREAAGQEAERRQREQAALPIQHRMGRPRESLPFVLSSHGEEVVTRRFRWQALGGAVLCLAGALGLATLLGVKGW